MTAEKKRYVAYGVITLATVFCFIYLLLLLLGFRLTDSNPYNTYALQADAWRNGRLDLGQNYSWLELAIYDGKYFCSFPPFPSYVLFPLTFFFGSQTPDYILMLLFEALAVWYLYKLAVLLGVKVEAAMLLTILVTIGANTLFIMVTPYVWFMAQFLCFTTAVLAICYAYRGKGGWALFFWAASVGCRPMQMIFLPVLLVLLYQAERRKDRESKTTRLILRRRYWALPMGGLALSYMLLNYLRFDSVLEFGHNYLPEFMYAEKGQFHIDYFQNNLRSLFRLPQFDEEGFLIINHFGDLSFLLTCPIVVVALVGIGYALLRKNRQLWRWGILIGILSMVYLLLVATHKTMGGWHFGNRYAIDILPYIFLWTCLLTTKYPGTAKYCVPLLVLGIGLNAVGTVIVYNGLS